METLKQESTVAASLSSPVLWHFRALPRDVQRVTIRRLALSGLGHEEIARRTGLPQEAVRRTIAEDECLQAKAWQLRFPATRSEFPRAAG
jgi:hypothetical protein